MSFEWRDPHENKNFFTKTKPIARFDTSLRFVGYMGAYPPDYLAKQVYGYHLSPQLTALNGAIYLSFPGSSYIGRFDLERDTTTFSRFSSAYEVDYQPMDTANFMKTSKAVQFQDTASRYIGVGCSATQGKVARIYRRQQPILFEGEKFYGSVVVSNARADKVETEFLTGQKKAWQYKTFLLKDGLLKVDFSPDTSAVQMVNFTLLDVYADQVEP